MIRTRISFRCRGTIALIALALMGSPARVHAQSNTSPGAMEAALSAFAGSDLSQKSGPLSKVGLDLALLREEFRRSQTTRALGPFRPSNELLRLAGDAVEVDAIAAGDAVALESDLRGLGMEVTGTAGRIVSGRLPIGALEAAAGLGSLQFMQPSMWTTNVGLTTSQGDVSMRTDNVRANLGLNGAGITIGALSDSYNFLGGAPADVASGDLPGVGNPNGFLAPVNVLMDDLAGPPAPAKTDEGRGMLQLVHDCAPAAALAFATADGGQGTFATNITNLRVVAGCRVVVDDVIYFAEPMFQDGIIAQAADACAAAGVPYFSSAGNQARNAYQSGFTAGGAFGAGTIPSAPGAPAFMGGTAHDFDPGPGVDNFQRITLNNNQRIVVSFQWAQRYFAVSGAPGAASDLDIYLLDGAAGQVLAGGVVANIGGDPIEVFAFRNTTGAAANFNLMIVNRAGPNPNLMKYVMFGGQIAEFDTNSGTIYGHANALGAEAVGAAPFFNTPAFGVSPAILEGFSSGGTTPILFTTGGVPINDPRADKPEITAPDGTNTTFFGSDIPQDADAFPNFFGTSAAAPHAASVAALMFQAAPGSTPAQIYSGLESTALDMGPAGYDNDSGFGLIQATGAIQAVSPCTVTCPANITAANDPNQCGAVVNYPAPTTSGTCGAVTCSPASGSFFPAGATTVTCASAAGSSCTFTVTVNDVQPPTITCPADITQNTDPGTCTAVVTYVTTASDNCPGVTLACNPPSGSTFPKGPTTVTCTATDGSGNTATCTFLVTVVDNQPPQISVSLSPTLLKPPNHKLQDITATVSVADNCPGVTYALTSITSNESDNGNGDGDQPDDIQDAAFGTPDLAFKLRAERAGGGTGRLYMVTYTATDGSGNQASAAETVQVLKSQTNQTSSAAGDLPVFGSVVPKVLMLDQNHPNPFKPMTTIDFGLPHDARVNLAVYDLAGRRVAQLVDGRLSAGYRAVDFDATGLRGGVYVYRLSVTNDDGTRAVLSRKLILTR